MPFSLGSLATIATRALTALATAVPAVEAFQRARGAGGGAEKRAAVLALVQAELTAAEIATGRDLAHDPSVLAAAGAVIDAVAAFHTILDRQAHAPGA